MSKEIPLQILPISYSSPPMSYFITKQEEEMQGQLNLRQKQLDTIQGNIVYASPSPQRMHQSFYPPTQVPLYRNLNESEMSFRQQADIPYPLVQSTNYMVPVSVTPNPSPHRASGSFLKKDRIYSAHLSPTQDQSFLKSSGTINFGGSSEFMKSYLAPIQNEVISIHNSSIYIPPDYLVQQSQLPPTFNETKQYQPNYTSPQYSFPARKLFNETPERISPSKTPLRRSLNFSQIGTADKTNVIESDKNLNSEYKLKEETQFVQTNQKDSSLVNSQFIKDENKYESSNIKEKLKSSLAQEFYQNDKRNTNQQYMSNLFANDNRSKQYQLFPNPVAYDSLYNDEQSYNYSNNSTSVKQENGQANNKAFTFGSFSKPYTLSSFHTNNGDNEINNHHNSLKNSQGYQIVDTQQVQQEAQSQKEKDIKVSQMKESFEKIILEKDSKYYELIQLNKQLSSQEKSRSDQMSQLTQTNKEIIDQNNKLQSRVQELEKQNQQFQEEQEKIIEVCERKDQDYQQINSELQQLKEMANNHQAQSGQKSENIKQVQSQYLQNNKQAENLNEQNKLLLQKVNQLQQNLASYQTINQDIIKLQNLLQNKTNEANYWKNIAEQSQNDSISKALKVKIQYLSTENERLNQILLSRCIDMRNNW